MAKYGPYFYLTQTWMRKLEIHQLSDYSLGLSLSESFSNNQINIIKIMSMYLNNVGEQNYII